MLDRFERHAVLQRDAQQHSAVARNCINLASSFRAADEHLADLVAVVVADGHRERGVLSAMLKLERLGVASLRQRVACGHDCATSSNFEAQARRHFANSIFDSSPPYI